MKQPTQTQNCLWDPKSAVIFENVTSRSRETYVKPEDQDEVLESEDSLKDEEAAKKAAYKELKLQVSLFYSVLNSHARGQIMGNKFQFQQTKFFEYLLIWVVDKWTNPHLPLVDSQPRLIHDS